MSRYIIREYVFDVSVGKILTTISLTHASNNGEVMQANELRRLRGVNAQEDDAPRRLAPM